MAKTKQTPHLSCLKGKRVRIVLISGEILIDKFIERTDKFLILENRKLLVRIVRQFGIYKEKNL